MAGSLVLDVADRQPQQRPPNTVKAYAHDLKDYFVFLAHHGMDWREVRLED